MTNSPNISIFSNARSNKPSGVYTLIQIVDEIKTGMYAEPVQAIRNCIVKKERDELKKKLPAVTFSGEFSHRKTDALTNYTGLICIDIDGLEDAIYTKEHIISPNLTLGKYVLCAFISPSGNGLKLIFRTNAGLDNHLIIFEDISLILSFIYCCKADKSGKDVTRLCFLSYDQDIYYNGDALPLFVNTLTPGKGVERIEAPEPTPEQKPQQKKKSDTENYWDKIHSIVTKTVQPAEGSYNAYINQFAIQANRYGLGINECADAVAHFCGWAEPDKEDLAVIKSVYSSFSVEHQKYLISGTLAHDLRGTGIKTESHAPESIRPKYDESIHFWYLIPKMDKEGVVATNPQGEPLGEYKFSYDDAITFLQNNGFYKYKAGEGYQFIHVDQQSNVIEIVNELKIKEFMIDYLKSEDSHEFKAVREMFRRGAKNYCSTGILEGLEYFHPDFKRDTKNAAFVYFQNQYIYVTAEGITAVDYTERKGAIWKRQKVEADYKKADFTGSDVNRYMWLVATGRKAEIDQRTPAEWDKYKSMCSTIGYLLHRYKSPVLTKAVISVDKSLRSGNDNNGRSGKSLFIKLVGKMLNVTTIDGRNFKFDAQRPFSKVNLDTGIINFDDIRPNFDFTRMFSMLTDEMTIDKMYQDPITIPYEDAPKFYLSSNSSLKGDGESTLARQQIIEFGTFFNAKHTPAIEFGRMFFFDWDADEYARYYCFMIDCLHLYLKEGLITFPLENYGKNKLIDTAGEEFIEHLDDTVKAHIAITTRYDSTQLFEKYLEYAKPKYPPKKNTWSKWVKMWADLNEMEYNAHKGGERDRSSGVDYYTFTLKNQINQDPEAGPVDDGKLPF